MQVHGWCNAGPRMVRCRSTDGARQVPGCANFIDGNTVVPERLRDPVGLWPGYNLLYFPILFYVVFTVICFVSL